MEKDCNTCVNHVQAATIDDIPPGCWSCLNRNWADVGAVKLPHWKPIEFRSGQVVPVPAGEDLAEFADALHRQIGGDHYKGLGIQPMEYSVANGLNACAHTAIKYITRKKGDKAKRLEDLDKAIHSIELYKQFIQDGLLED